MSEPVSALIGKVIDWAKSPRQTSAIFLACLMFLVLPQPWLQKLGLETIQRYRGWIAAVFILSGSVTIVELGFTVWQQIKSRREMAASIKERENYLRTLSEGEQYILAKYFMQKTETQYLPAEDGNVGALIVKGVIYRASNVGRLTTFAYNIQPWAKEYILKHPEVIANPSPPLRTPFQRH